MGGEGEGEGGGRGVSGESEGGGGGNWTQSSPTCLGEVGSGLSEMRLPVAGTTPPDPDN